MGIAILLFMVGNNGSSVTFLVSALTGEVWHSYASVAYRLACIFEPYTPFCI